MLNLTNKLASGALDKKSLQTRLSRNLSLTFSDNGYWFENDSRLCSLTASINVRCKNSIAACCRRKELEKVL